MNFADLSKYDDLCSDIFLDELFLWFRTTKMNTALRKPRVQAKQILDIIQRRVVEERKPNAAIAEILEMEFFKQYFFRKDKQRQEFAQQAKRYLYMYMPTAGYEVGDTQRYKVKGRRTEACLIATKVWNVGDQISLCTGMIATLDPEDDARLRQRDQDFSVMWSQRKGCTCLFLGPARFVNHDCDANCRFISQGQNAVTFQVVRKIECGEEMTAYYGGHYFGVDNIECRCATCEANGRGYFAPQHPAAQDDTDSGVRRSRRKRKTTTYQDYITFKPESKKGRVQKRPAGETISLPSEKDAAASRLATDKAPTNEMTASTTEGVSNLLETPPSKEFQLSEEHHNSGVMSIGFLCKDEFEQTRQQQQQHQQLKLTSPVDLLYDVLMDANMTVSNEDCVAVHLTNSDNSPPSPPSYDTSLSPSTEDDSSSDSKNAGHCSISASIQQGQQKGANTDNPASTELGSSVRDKDTDTPKGDSEIKLEPELRCVACDQKLQQDKISQQLGCDNYLTAELVTWSWTPSAMFTDWRPKRCPRCERHYLIFGMEWPVRRARRSREKDPGTQETTPTETATATGAAKQTSGASATSNHSTSTTNTKPKPTKKTPAKSRKKAVDPAVQEYVDKLFLSDSPLSPLSEYAGDDDLELDHLCI